MATIEPNSDLKRPAPESTKPPRKRKRIVISCTECHRRKQKCDRAAPCSNCTSRGKESACHYENEAARKQQVEEDGLSAANSASQSSVNDGTKSQSISATQVANLGYAKENGNSTLELFKKIENFGGNSTFPSSAVSESAHNNGLKEKYKSLIRQLPSKLHIEQLVETFFHDINPTYYSLEKSVFMDLWAEWSKLSFSTLNKGPMELQPDLRFFPGLLFQVLAQALLFQPPDYDPSLDTIKYAAGMSLDDLASDYSESGVQLLTILGKRHTTLVTVQAGFLRTSFLKNCGMIPESWHSLSYTIRDAQEIGLHKDTVDHYPASPGQALEDLWAVQLRRRMWLLLSVWDVHMALVLGRPTTLDLRDGWATFPIDAPTPKNRREVAPLPRSASDPPTPLTALIWSAEITAPLRDILTLEKEGPHLKDLTKIDTMHKQILMIGKHRPAFFRTLNPDTTWDNHPDCYWLPRTRPGFDSGLAFTVMALHRPYIFTSATSRAAALNAALEVLRAQRAYFHFLNSKHYKMFNLVLNTFDATVLVAAIHILHPFDNRDKIDDSLQHFDWAIERFQAIAQRNDMAKAALGVIKAVHVRLKKALGLYKSSTAGQDTAAMASPLSKLDPELAKLSSGTYSGQGQQILPNSRSRSSISTSSTSTQSQTQPSSNSSISYTPPDNNNNNNNNNNSTWDTSVWPAKFDFSNFAPLQPMHDLLYNDLTGASLGEQFGDVPSAIEMYDPGLSMPSGDAMGSAGPANNNWQFEGDFGNDSFWGFMNTYIH